MKKRNCFNCIDSNLNDIKIIDGKEYFKCKSTNRYQLKVEWNCCNKHFMLSDLKK